MYSVQDAVGVVNGHARDHASEKGPQDVIIFDMNVTGADGTPTSALQELKSQPAVQPVPIILLGAPDVQPDEAARCLQLYGCDFVSAAGLTPTLLLARVDVAIKNHELRSWAKRSLARIGSSQMRRVDPHSTATAQASLGHADQREMIAKLTAQIAELRQAHDSLDEKYHATRRQLVEATDKERDMVRTRTCPREG